MNGRPRFAWAWAIAAVAAVGAGAGACASTKGKPAFTATATSVPTAMPTATRTACPGSAAFSVVGGDAGGPALTENWIATVDGCGEIVSWTLGSPIPTQAASTGGGFSFVSAGVFLRCGGFASGSFAVPVDGAISAVVAGAAAQVWSQSSPIPNRLGGNAMACDGSFAYAIGGASSTSEQSVIYSAPVSGALAGPWSLAPTPFPVAQWGAAGFVAGSYVYVVGGVSTLGFGGSTWTAPVLAGGALGTWSPQAGVPGGWAGGAWLTDGGVLLIAGGRPATNACYTVPVLPGGTLGAWTTVSALPGGRAYGALAKVVISGATEVFLIGGWDPVTGQTFSSVYRAALAGGVLSSWSETMPLPHPLCGAAGIPNR